MTGAAGECPGWVRIAFDRLEVWEGKFVLADHLSNLDEYPEWVLRVAGELMRQLYPAIRFKTVQFNAHFLGVFLGQQSARIHQIAEIFDKVPSEFTPEQERVFQTIAEVIAADSILCTVANTIDEFLGKSGQIDEFVEICKFSCNSALEEGSLIDLQDFFCGFADGVKKRPKDVRGAYTDASPIYRALLLGWPEVQKLGSVTELRGFLRSHHLSEQMIGEQKRLEKLCSRIKLKFRAPGRPKKKNSDTTAKDL